MLQMSKIWKHSQRMHTLKSSRRIFEATEKTNMKKKKTDNCALAFKAQNNKDVWYVDSSCSTHMTGDRRKFISLKEKKDGTISFGNDGSSNVIGSGTITLGRKDSLAKNVLLVEKMNHNLLSVGKMCDQGHTILFNSTKCEIRKGRYGEIVATAS